FSVLQSPREAKGHRHPCDVPPPRCPEVVPHLQIPAQHAVECLLRALTELTPAVELQRAEIEEDELRVLGVKLGGILGIHCVPSLETTRYQRLQIARASVLTRHESQEGVGNNKFFETPPPNYRPSLHFVISLQRGRLSRIYCHTCRASADRQSSRIPPTLQAPTGISTSGRGQP